MIAGRYSLDRELGRGGMGVVWLGRDEVLGRQVALKRIGRPGADGTDLARAEREARLTARLSHPRVVAVLNLAVDDETGAQWLVMEYVDGSTLSELIRDEGRMSPDEAAALMWQVADALVAAHEQGIVHRDVKPSNILVDRQRSVKLSDFGIARGVADPSLTMTGMVTGSPAYLAPEVAAGGRGDEASDVWSLGATLFHVLSGRPPYDMRGDNLLGGLYRIVNEEPPRLDDAGWLAPLLEATMVKDPSRRWSMAQVRDFLAGTAVAVGPSDHASPTPDDTRPLAAASSATRPALPARAWLVGGLALATVVLLALVPVLDDDSPADPAAGVGADTATDRDSADPRPTRSAEAKPATEQGMRSFIRGYVAALGSDPDAAWEMLTPRFQRASGGIETYRDFWSGVGNGRILDLAADPRQLVVSYRVRFDNFGTGRRPTVLDLVHEDGRYLIDGERTEGFVPAA